MSPPDKRPLGRILLEQKLVSVRDLDAALDVQARNGGRLASRLAEAGALADADVLRALALQHDVQGIDVMQVCLPVQNLDWVPREIAERQQVLPVAIREDRMILAMANPGERRVLDELEFVTGRRVVPCVALAAPLERVIAGAYDAKVRGETFYAAPHCSPEAIERFVAARSGASALPGPPPPDSDDVASEPRGADAAAGDLDAALGAAALPGTTPLGVAAVAPVEPEPPSLPSDAPSVLVVEPDAETARALRAALWAARLRVVLAVGGKEALRAVKTGAPSAIVLEAELDDVHGFEVARRVVGSKKFGATPIVLTSAVRRTWREIDDAKSTFSIAAYLEKPQSPAKVVDAVRRALAAAGGEPSEPVASPRIGPEAEKALADGVEAYRAGDVEGAIVRLRRGLELAPNELRLHFHLGLVLGKGGYVFEAIRELERALALDSTHFAAAKNLAVLYQNAGFRNKAADTWQRALALAPDTATRDSIRERVMGLL